MYFTKEYFSFIYTTKLSCSLNFDPNAKMSRFTMFTMDNMDNYKITVTMRMKKARMLFSSGMNVVAAALDFNSKPALTRLGNQLKEKT